MSKRECENCGQLFDEDEMVDDLCEKCYREETIDLEVDEEDD